MTKLEKEEDSTIKEVQTILKTAVTQIMNNEVRKVCFEQCFQSKKSHSPLNRFDHQCLSRCMDKMFHAHSIVEQATIEKVKDLGSSENVQNI
ncbi:Tim10/DDP family zinc finger family protein [Cryptosporidium meleagridis]|uniref:Mitochondrial import inner membrane translocase subunit n=1 Tax=Cryptosporidium meleagridis TaxID=93969 RepID=A0A2P4Z585_9CRYT|nr:Tim10/DDP family zinc finger family protein [Cryptosporidium meleagridis]